MEPSKDIFNNTKRAPDMSIVNVWALGYLLKLGYIFKTCVYSVLVEQEDQGIFQVSSHHDVLCFQELLMDFSQSILCLEELNITLTLSLICLQRMDGMNWMVNNFCVILTDADIFNV